MSEPGGMGSRHGVSGPAGFVHDVPTPRVVFAVGALARVAEEASALGGRVLLISGTHEDGYADQVSTALGDRVVDRIREVAQHVPTKVVTGVVSRARRAHAEVIVSVGGGSATGLAKAVARETRLPIVAVPTTYAGSEMTNIWGLSDAQGKTTGRDQVVLPQTVVYDPALTVSLPPGTTAASGMNALAHCVEALYAVDATPVTTLLARKAIRALASGLPRSVDHGDDLGARTDALYGAWLAGWVLGSTTMGLHHKLAHILGGRYGLPHAQTHSALLPQVAAFNAPAAAAALHPVAQALGIPGGTADDAGRGLFDLAVRLGAPTSLDVLGLEVESLDEIAEAIVAADIANPRSLDREGVLELLVRAHGGVRP